MHVQQASQLGQRPLPHRRRRLGAAVLGLAVVGASAQVFVAPVEASRRQRQPSDLTTLGTLGLSPLLLAAPAEVLGPPWQLCVCICSAWRNCFSVSCFRSSSTCC
ncbi:unnamed protein product [Symbiodinium sp. CCMP2592]|nr:unnamed protein product [Symbiodinium sp. CCMP2592]